MYPTSAIAFLSENLALYVNWGDLAKEKKRKKEEHNEIAQTAFIYKTTQFDILNETALNLYIRYKVSLPLTTFTLRSGR